MRDVRKNKVYFESFIEYQRSRIEKKLEKLQEADEAKKQRILVSLTSYEIDLLKAEFSIGAPIEKMRTLLCDSQRKTGDGEDHRNRMSVVRYDDRLYYCQSRSETGSSSGCSLCDGTGRRDWLESYAGMGR